MDSVEALKLAKGQVADHAKMKNSYDIRLHWGSNPESLVP
jgi:hypothetical protein